MKYALIAILIALAGCSSFTETVIVSTPFSMNITSPAQNETLSDNTIVFSVNLQGFSFDKSSAYFSLDDGKNVEMTATKYTISNLAYGKHKISVTAERSDGQKLTQTVDFRIGTEEQEQTTNTQPTIQPVGEAVFEDSPSFGIITPTPGRTSTVNAVSVSLLPANVEIVGAGPHVAGQGHFVYTLDDNAPFEVFTETHVIRDLSEGEHTLKIALVTNDGRPYNKEAEVKFTHKKFDSADYL